MAINLNEKHFKDMEITFFYSFQNREKCFYRALDIGICIECSNKTVIPFDICYQCIEKFGLEMTSEFDGFGVKSTIPRKQNEILKKLPYRGDVLTKEELDLMYGNCFAPYSITYINNLIIDSSLKRCLLSLVNSSNNPNAIFIMKNFEVCLQFLRDIKADESIYVYYDFKDNYFHATK
jgi:hypothetical protein